MIDRVLFATRFEVECTLHTATKMEMCALITMLLSVSMVINLITVCSKACKCVSVLFLNMYACIHLNKIVDFINF